MRKRLNLLSKDQSGVALVIALILMVALTLIGLASTFSSTYEVKLSGNKRGSTDAFYAADAGAQWAKKDVTNFVDHSIPLPSNPTNAQGVIEFYPGEFGCPRGAGGFGQNAVNCLNFMVESNGEDQIDLNLSKSKCTVQEKVARVVPKEGD